MPETFGEDLEEAKAISEVFSKFVQKIAQAKTQPVQRDNVNTNNCFGNMDYSPLAPTDTLNANVSPAMAQALAGSAITTVAAPAAAPLAVGVAIPSAIVHDLFAGQPSFSASITGHHGETFGHFQFP